MCWPPLTDGSLALCNQVANATVSRSWPATVAQIYHGRWIEGTPSPPPTPILLFRPDSFKPFTCVDNDGLNRCVADSACSAAVYPARATLYTECETESPTSMTKAERNALGAEIKSFLTTTCPEVHVRRGKELVGAQEGAVAIGG